VLLVAEEDTHGAKGRGGAHDDDEHRSSERDQAASSTTFRPCACASQHFVPVSGAGRRGKRAVEACAVEFAHVRTSSIGFRSRVRGVEVARPFRSGFQHLADRGVSEIGV
jgi:hypothetical protein